MTGPIEELRDAINYFLKHDEHDGSHKAGNLKTCGFIRLLQKAVLQDDWAGQSSNMFEDLTKALCHDTWRQDLTLSLNQCPEELTSCYISIITDMAQNAMLPREQANEDEVYPEEKFATTREKTYISGTIINTLLTQLWDCCVEDGEGSGGGGAGGEDACKVGRKIVQACIPACIVLCASHRQHHPWADSRSVQVTQDLLQTLCKISSCDSMAELLCGSHHGNNSQDNKDVGWMSRGCLPDVLNILKHRLTRQTWKQEPASRHVYYWCLGQVKHPNLGCHLDSVLPPALLFVDDYQVQNKILGICCLQHIIDNVDPTELRWYGRGVVIYEALHHHIYSQEAALLQVLYPCLLAVIGVIEKPPHKADEPRMPSRYDTVFQTILTNMESEQKLILRLVHAKCLSLYIDKMAITVLRHIKRLLRVLTQYLEVYDGAEQTARLDVLHALKALIVQAWPRIPLHCDVILKCLLRLLYDVTTCDMEDMCDTVKQQLISQAEECLLYLKRCCGPIVEQTLQSIHGCEASNKLVDECLQRVISGT